MLIGVVIAVMLMIAGLPASVGASSRPIRQPGSQSNSLAETGGHERYRKMAAFFRNGTAVAGYVVSVSDDSLILQTDQGIVVIGLDSLSHVTIMHDKQAGRYGLFGIMAGIWAGYLAAYQANDNPTAFFASDDNDNSAREVLATVFFGGIGGSLFALVGKAAQQDITLVFTDHKRDRQLALNQLRRLTRPSSPTGPRVHLNVTAARVFTRVSKPFEDQIKRAGYQVGRYSNLMAPEAERATATNLLRKLELTITIRESLQVGLTTMWLGEPAVWGQNFFLEQTDQWELAQKFDAVGYFATARLMHGQPWQPDEGIGWFVGAGIGIVNVDYELVIRKLDYQSGNPTTIRRLEKTPLAGCLFAGCDIHLTKTHSFGFNAEYVVAPSYHVPGVPEAGIVDVDVKVGNGSIGIGLGLHF